MTKQKMNKKRLVKGATLGLLSFAALLDVFGIGQKDKVYADANPEPNDGQKNPEGTTVVSDESQTLDTKANLSITTDTTETAPSTSEPAPEILPEASASETPAAPASDAQSDIAPVTDETPAPTVIDENEPVADDTTNNVSQETSTDPKLADDTVESETTPVTATDEPDTTLSHETEINTDNTDVSTTTDQDEPAPVALPEKAPAKAAVAEATENAYQLVNVNNGQSLHDQYIDYLKSTGITDAAQLETLGAQVPEQLDVTNGTVLKAITIGGTVYLPVLVDSDSEGYFSQITNTNVNALTLTVTATNLAQVKNNQIKYIAVNTIVPEGSDVTYLEDSVDKTSSTANVTNENHITKGVVIDRKNSKSVAWTQNPETGLMERTTSNIQYGYKYDSNHEAVEIDAPGDAVDLKQWALDNLSGSSRGISKKAQLITSTSDSGYAGLNSYTDAELIVTMGMNRSTLSEAVMDNLSSQMNPILQYPSAIRDGVGNIIRFRLEQQDDETIDVDTSDYTDKATIDLEVTPENQEVIDDIVRTKGRYFTTQNQNGAITNVVQGTDVNGNTGKVQLTISKDQISPDNSITILLNNYYYKIKLNLTGKVNYKQVVIDKDGNTTTTDLGSEDATLGTAFQEAPTAPENTTYKGRQVTPTAETVAWGTTTVTDNYAANLEVTQNAEVVTQSDDHVITVNADTNNATAFKDFGSQDLTDDTKFTVDSGTDVSSVTATDTGFEVTFTEDTTAADHTIILKNKTTGTSYTLNINLQGQVVRQKTLDGDVIATSEPTTAALGTAISETTPDTAETGTHYIDTTAAPDTKTIVWGTTTITDNYGTDHVSAGTAEVDTSKANGREVTVEAGTDVDMTSFNNQDLTDETKFTITNKSHNITGISAKDNQFDVIFDDKTNTATHEFTIRNNETGETYTQTINLQGHVITQKVLDDATPVTIEDTLVALETKVTPNAPDAAPGTHYERTDVTPTGAVAAVWGTTTVTYYYGTDHASTGMADVDTSEVTGREVTVEAGIDADMTAFEDVDTQTPNAKYTFEQGGNSTITSIKTSADGQGFDVTFADDTNTATHEFTIRNNETGETYTQTINLKGTVTTQNAINGETVADSGTNVLGDLGTTVDITQPAAPEGDYHLEATPTVPKVFTWGTTTVTYNYVADDVIKENHDVITTNKTHTVTVAPKDTTDLDYFTGDLTNTTDYTLTKDADIQDVTLTDGHFNVTFADMTDTTEHDLKIRNNKNGLTYHFTITLQGQLAYQTKYGNTITAIPDVTATGALGTDLTALLDDHIETAKPGYHYTQTTTDPKQASVFTWGTTTVTYNYVADGVIEEDHDIITTNKTHTVTVTPEDTTNLGHFTGDLTDNILDKDEDIAGITADETGFHVTFKDTTATAKHHFTVRNKDTGETYTLNINLQGTVTTQNAINGDVVADSGTKTQGDLGTTVDNITPPTAPEGDYHLEATPTVPKTFIWGTTMVTYNYVADGVIEEDHDIITTNKTHTVTVTPEDTSNLGHFTGDLTDDILDKDEDITGITADETGFHVTFKDTTATAEHHFTVRDNDTGETYKLTINLQGTVNYMRQTDEGTRAPEFLGTKTGSLGADLDLTAHRETPTGMDYVDTTVDPKGQTQFVWGTTTITHNYTAATEDVYTQNATVNTNDPIQTKGHTVNVTSDQLDKFQPFENQPELLQNTDFEVQKDDQVVNVITTDQGFEITFAENTDTAQHTITMTKDKQVYILNLTLTGDVQYEVVWPDGTHHLITEPNAPETGYLTTNGHLGGLLPTQTIDDAFVKAHGDAATQAMLASGKYVLKTVTPDPTQTKFVWGNQTLQIKYGAKATTPDTDNETGGNVTVPDTNYPDGPDPEVPVDPEEPEVPEVPVDPEEPEVPEVPVDPETPEPEPTPEPDSETAGNTNTAEPTPQPIPAPQRPAQGTAGLTQVADRATAQAKTPAQQTLPQTGDDQVEASRLSALGALGVLGSLFGGTILSKKKKERD